MPVGDSYLGGILSRRPTQNSTTHPVVRELVGLRQQAQTFSIEYCFLEISQGILVMGVILKRCVQCRKMTKIGASKSRCKSCRHAHTLAPTQHNFELGQKPSDDDQSGDTFDLDDLPFTPGIFLFNGIGRPKLFCGLVWRPGMQYMTGLQPAKLS
jgi:hypothetical protein